MKNQYFGDVNDYLKYGLLRALSRGGGIKLGVCWMLTPDDGRADGGKTGYLGDPGTWRDYDPELFDLLGLILASGARRCLEQAEGALAGARFFSQELADDMDEREAYFDRAWQELAEADLVFFDPDNGLQVKSTPPGARGSCKYLYFSELQEAWRRGHSLLVYQHFPRRPRRTYLAERAGQLQEAIGVREVHAFEGPHTAFLLAPQAGHGRLLGQRARRFAAAWQGAAQAHHFPTEPVGAPG